MAFCKLENPSISAKTLYMCAWLFVNFKVPSISSIRPPDLPTFWPPPLAKHARVHTSCTFLVHILQPLVHLRCTTLVHPNFHWCIFLKHHHWRNMRGCTTPAAQACCITLVHTSYPRCRPAAPSCSLWCITLVQFSPQLTLVHTSGTP